jgi:hypothetical protein
VSEPHRAPAPGAPVTHLLYLHGFRSSPRSTKAMRMQAWVRANRPDLKWLCPQLAPSPRATIDGLRRRLDAQQPEGGKRERILAVFEPRSNTMKLGMMKAQLPWALEAADLAWCHSGGLDWDAAEALAALGERATVCSSIDALVQQVAAAARPGDHVVCMSNGGFGGIHGRLLEALRQRDRR